MRTITAKQWQQLEDLSAEGLIGGLLLQAAEKDIHVTELLGALSALEVRHAHFEGFARDETTIDDGIHLVFAGGTCLSKAYRLTSRMSEDIDIKVVLSEPSRKLKKTISPRARLKALHGQVIQTLESLDFGIPADVKGVENPRVQDQRRYWVVQATYESRGPQALSLRPEIKLEMNHRAPRLETAPVEFGYLHEQIPKLALSRIVTMPCISVGETLAEKVVALLRRTAADTGGARGMDPALVRHIYDVHRIISSQPHAMAEATRVFSAVVDQDAQDSRGHPAFDADPVGVLRSALEGARTNERLRKLYDEKVLPLIYDGRLTAYEVAFAGFESAARRLLDGLAT
jgi:predicted nucleotidyltransferase component of viral defense system